jgi:L-seryl-tRNA(Ser) seleniumtransferase
MFDSIRNAAGEYLRGLSRRELFQRAGGLSISGLLGKSGIALAQGASGLSAGSDIYQSIGVRPLINCRGTLTVVGGSLMLPEVRAAMDAAARHYVQIDEMMEGIGKRLAELTGAEWGMVSSGCAAALAHATAACVAGGNPDLHVRIPNLAGFARDEVIIPYHSRNVYDAAIRSVGVRIIEVATPQELENALGPRAAMVYIFAGPRADSGPLPFETITRIAKQRNIPVLVDAAAEMLTVPNIHLQRGATLVGYSGGKVLRGPQSAGMLIGRKDLVQAAWVHSAPHHGNGRMMKFGKEEAMGMLMAVEMWMKRDHKAEMKEWIIWLNNISARVSKVEGVTTTTREARGLSNHSPGLSIRWDGNKLGITGEEVSKILYTTEPRVALGGGGGQANAAANASGTGISISAFMMAPGEDKIVGDRIYQILSQKRPARAIPAPAAPAGDLTGRWDVRIEYAAGGGVHTLHLKQDGNNIAGTHQGEYLARDMSGSIDGENVRLSSNVTEAHGDALSFKFSGKLQGDSMSGVLDMGEYLTAKWSAKRYVFGTSGRGAGA